MTPEIHLFTAKTLPRLMNMEANIQLAITPWLLSLCVNGAANESQMEIKQGPWVWEMQHASTAASIDFV